MNGDRARAWIDRGGVRTYVHDEPAHTGHGAAGPLMAMWLGRTSPGPYPLRTRLLEAYWNHGGRVLNNAGITVREKYGLAPSRHRIRRIVFGR